MDDCRLSSTDRATVDRAFGFAVPPTWLKLLELVQDADGSVNGRDFSLFQNVTGLLLGDAGDAYPGTPPELFLIGRTGMDGINCGCVIHDAKLASDPPLAMFDPTQLRADYLGLDTRRSLGVLMGLHRAQRDQATTGDDADAYLRSDEVIESLGFDPKELPAEPPIGLRPRTPPGWKLAMTADGLGVMAEGRLFAPDQSFDEDAESFEPLDIADYVSNARAALAVGHTATALWHARNGYTFWAAEGMPAEITDLLCDVYRAMGRAHLIPRVEREAALHRQRDEAR
jgi:hypothetical protein